MRRLLAGSGMAPCPTPHGEDGDPDPDRSRRDGAGDQDPSRVTELAAGRVADHRDEVPNRPMAGKPCGEASLEA